MVGQQVVYCSKLNHGYMQDNQDTRVWRYPQVILVLYHHSFGWEFLVSKRVHGYIHVKHQIYILPVNGRWLTGALDNYQAISR